MKTEHYPEQWKDLFWWNKSIIHWMFAFNYQEGERTQYKADIIIQFTVV